MNSFDLFNTLVTSRRGDAGEAPVEEHFPIAENVAKVQPGDIIVSDYYDPAKAERIVREVCKLPNALFVSEDGKATGKVWKTLPSKPEHHLGDNQAADVDIPRRYGIATHKSTLHEFTDTERQFDAPIARVMREARLITWHSNPEPRGLQLHQIERNFPFLLKVGYVLCKVAIGYDRLLLCSRDCYSLHQLMVLMFGMYRGFTYFHNSRVHRYRPTEKYIEYAKEKIGDPRKTLIVDMCGTGNSLKYFTDMFGGTPLLVVSAWNNVPKLVSGGIRETSNLAPHDPIDMDTMLAAGMPKPKVVTMVNALHVAATIAARECLAEPSYSLDWALKRMEDPRTECLWADHLADSKAAFDLLNSGALPHPVLQ